MNRSNRFCYFFGIIFFSLLMLLMQPMLIPTFVLAEEDKMVSDCIGKKCEEKESQNKEESPAADQVNDAAADLRWWDFIKVLLAFGFVIILLMFVLKLVNRKNRMYDQHRFMRNLGGVSVGPQKSVQLIHVGHSYYLIGVGDHVELIKEITDESEIKFLEQTLQEQNQLNISTGWMHRLLAFWQQRSNQTQEQREKISFQQQFESRLKEMKEERRRQIQRMTKKESRKDD